MNQRTLISFPCSFPIKVMGEKTEDFLDEVVQVALAFDPTFDRTHVELRTSSGGKYLGVTLTVMAVDQAQLDALYRALSSHPLVRVVL